MIGRTIGLLSIGVIGLALWGLIREVRRPQRLRLSTNLIGLVMAPIMLVVNVVVLRQAAPGLLGPALLVLGLGFGLAWGQSAKVVAEEERIVAERSVLHLLFWGVAYGITQVLATFADAAWVAGGLVAMFWAAGTTLGTNLNLLVRQVRARRAVLPGPAVSEPADAEPMKLRT